MTSPISAETLSACTVTALQVDDIAPADQNPQYVVKYAERIGALFGTAEQFAASFSAAVLIVPTRLWA